MGRLTNERKVHFNYSIPFLEVWQQQSQEMKNWCEALGQPYGYTGQNTFFVLMHLYLLEKYSEQPLTFYRRIAI